MEDISANIVNDATISVAPTSGKRGSSRKAVAVDAAAVVPKRARSAIKSRPDEAAVVAPPPATESHTDAVAKTPRQHKPEPLLTPNPRRYVLFPIEHPDVFAMYKRHQATEWKAEDMDLSRDLTDWEKLTDNERHFIKHVLAFFAASDGIVMENLATRFSNEVQWPEARQYYAVQMKMEAVHSETYSLLIDEYIKDVTEKAYIFNAIETIPCIAKKAKWAIQWIVDKDADFATRLLAFAIVEGIFFSGAFCAIYWLKERGLMPGLTASNEWIARDEALHTEFACVLYSHLRRHVSKSTVFKIFRQALKIEKEFICDALPCSLIGMKAESMCQYLEFVADRLLVQLGYPKLYEATNPFDFMDRISIEGKTNFFEKRVTSYSVAGVDADGTAPKKVVITSTEDF